MVNFREELNKLKEEKLEPKGKYAIAVEEVVKKLIDFFKNASIYDMLREHNLLFTYEENDICVKDTFQVLFKVPMDTVKDARLTLIYLKDKFKKEKFEVTSFREDDASVASFYLRFKI